MTPAGAVTVAVSATLPVADELSVASTKYVIVLPEGMFTVLLILPLPLAVKPVALPVAVAV